MTEQKVNLYFQSEFISSQESHPMLKNPPYELTLTIPELITPKERQIRKRKASVPGHGKKHAGDVVNLRNESDNAESDQIDTDDSIDQDLIPRPHNAFIIFRTDLAEKMKRTNDPQRVSIRVVSKMASKQWKNETETVRAFFQILAEMYLHRHKIKYPHYRYAPKNRKKPSGSIKKRKHKKSTLSKAKRDELRKQRKDRIIIWNINDVVTDESSSVPDSLALSSMYHSMPLSNPFQQHLIDFNNELNITVPMPEENYFRQMMQTTQQQHTFIHHTNHTESPLSFATTSPPYHYSQYDNNAFNDMDTLTDSISSLESISNSSVSSPSLDSYILWDDLCDDNSEKDVPFGLSSITDEVEQTTTIF